MARRKKNPGEAEAPSWRAIRQKGVKRSTSTAARRRRLTKVGRWTAIALGVLVLAGGVAYAIHFSGTHFASVSRVPRTSVLTQVDFLSNGVLDRSWFEREYPLPRDIPSLEFDIFALKNRLEAFGQIDSAEVSIALPSTLIVRVKEKQPVLRARVRDPQGQIRVVLIASDGTVFAGEQYPPDAVRRLPGLVGARLQWEGGGIRPVPGVTQVADLLGTARELTPELYADWQLVSFERFDGDPAAPEALISIKSGFIERIVFAPHSFEPQLRKLNEVVMVAKEREARGMRKVDLSFSDQAIVQY